MSRYLYAAHVEGPITEVLLAVSDNVVTQTSTDAFCINHFLFTKQLLGYAVPDTVSALSPCFYLFVAHMVN